MGRKTNDVSNAETVTAATAEAAAILTADLAAVSHLMRANLKGAGEADSYNERESLFEDAMRLVDAAAKLSKALARVKGELRQTISVERGSVERVPKSTEIAPQFAPNKIAQIA